MFKNIFRQIKWTWQRIFRQWDDRIIWSIDLYLAEFLPEWLQKLKEVKKGIPVEYFDIDDWDQKKYKYIDGAEERAIARWNNNLDQIIIGFKSYQTLIEETILNDDPRYDELMNKFENGFNLLKNNFSNLWD